MTASSTVGDLIRRLQSSWPDWLPPLLPSEDLPSAESHLLAGELEALLQGNASSLPFFPAGSGEIAWITLASEEEALRAAYRDLRAWLLPSVGWEDPRGAFVPSGSSHNPLIDTLSSAGYIRWRTRRDPAIVQRIVNRLRAARDLARARPERLVERMPSLLELRQRFVAALVAGDRSTAEQAIETIDDHRLDAATNTSFLRIRLLDHFGDPSRIVEMPELEHLVHVRLPQRVRLAICRTIHATRLSDSEATGDLNEIRRIYNDVVDPLIGQLIDSLWSGGWSRATTLVRLPCLEDRQRRGRRAILAEADDTLLQSLLGSMTENAAAHPTPEALEERFFEARKQQDWRAVQELGEMLVSANPEIAPILRKSLEARPNKGLRDHLESLGQHPLVDDAVVPQVAATTTLPQTWPEWLLLVPSGKAEALELFLETHERLVCGSLICGRRPGTH